MQINRNQGQLVLIAFEMMKANGSTATLVAAANSARYMPEVTREVLKAASEAGGLNDVDFGSHVAPYRQAVDAFIESLRDASIFDQILPNMRRLPLHTRIVSATYAITGSQVGEGLAKPISQMTIGGSELELMKAATIIVLSKEIFVNSTSGAQALLSTELRNGVVSATNAIFIEKILNGVTPINSAGSSVANILADVENLFDAVQFKSLSALYFVTNSATATKLASKPATNGDGFAFPTVSPMGGTLAGIPLLVTDALEPDSDGSRLLLLDAQGIAGNSDTITLDVSEETLLELDSAPDNPTNSGTVMTSLFQNGLRALKAERYLGAEVIRQNAVAYVEGVNY